MRPIVITGDSHLAALARGLRLCGQEIAPERVTFWPLGTGRAARTKFFEIEEGARMVTTTAAGWRNRSFSKESVASDGRDPVVAVSLPLHTSGFLQRTGWNTHVPWSMVRRPREFPLSDQAVEALMADESTYPVAFVAALKSIGLSVAVIEAPRFFRNAPYLKSRRLDVCSHVDKLCRERISRALAEAGVPVIAQPAQTVAADGTTDPVYKHEDPSDRHHGNAIYGRLTMAEIAAFADSMSNNQQ